jgi:hypothetical protein
MEVSRLVNCRSIQRTYARPNWTGVMSVATTGESPAGIADEGIAVRSGLPVDDQVTGQGARTEPLG